MRRIEFWRNHLGAARDAYAVIVRALAEFEPVTVVADEGEGRTAEGWVGDGIDVIELPIDDSWLRDNGPMILTDGSGGQLGVDFDFNGWGERVAPWDRDAAMAGPLCDHLGIEHRHVPVVLEGGAVANDGEGTFVVTESSVLHPSRNPDMTRERMEQVLVDELGATVVVWLPRGLADDPTNGHVDNVVAFVGPGQALLQTTTDASDPDYTTARENRALLEAAGIEVVEIDVLPHVQCFDQLVEVPYVNYYVGNDAVIIPLAGAAADREMVGRIADCFPGRKAVGVPGTVLAYGGGGVHCITRGIPA
jgi:agmatine deiminase